MEHLRWHWFCKEKLEEEPGHPLFEMTGNPGVTRIVFFLARPVIRRLKIRMKT